MQNILVVEDHDDLRHVIAHNVKRWGYRAIEAENANNALIALDDFSIDLIILDLMLPGLSGQQFLKIIRETEKSKNIPVIIASIINQEDEIIGALNLGADDYIAKPFSFNYLQAKTAALLRRAENKVAKSLAYAGIKIRNNAHAVIIEDETVPLTPKEHELLKLFFKNIGRVFTRESLLSKVWGYDSDINTRTVDAHISSLRKKLKGKGSVIKSISKIGYGVDV